MSIVATKQTFPPVPHIILLGHEIIRSRKQVARTTSDLEHAISEHAAATERLARLEAQERAEREAAK